MEKIWAKANGNYDSIPAGDLPEAMAFLTGSPTFAYYNDDPSTVNKIGSKAWDLIKDAEDKKYVMSASVKTNGNYD